MATRWGIVSAGKISNDFALAVSTLPASEHILTAVAARDQARANEFAQKLGIPKAYSTYEDLAADPNVDVVYIGSINTEHLKLGKLFLEAGKHLLCEKPLCMNKKESQQLIDLAKSKNLFLMEAIWSRFIPTYVKIREEIEEGTIGDVLQIQANFGVLLNHKERVTKRALGGSVILDIGVYTIQLATMIFGGKPSSIYATGGLNTEGIDDSMTAVLTYAGGKVAVLQAHSLVSYVNEARIIGTKGTIRISPPFWCSTEIDVASEPFTIQLPDKQGFVYHNSVALRYEAMEVRQCIRQGLTQSPVLPWQESLDIAGIEDEIRRQIGVVFDQD